MTTNDIKGSTPEELGVPTGDNTMSKHDDGGPAFPVSVNIPPGHFYKGPAADSGMSLHAFYVGLAMQAILSVTCKEPRGIDSWRPNPKDVARIAVEYADAMIAEMRRREVS